MISPRDLADFLCSGQLRVSTGIWLLPLDLLGCEIDEAHRLNLEPIDLRNRLLDSLDPEMKYTGINADRLVALIDDIASEKNDWSGALVYNIDLLLAGLNSADRDCVWNDLLIALPRRTRAILIAIPETAVNLLPVTAHLEVWQKEHRLVGIISESKGE